MAVDGDARDVATGQFARADLDAAAAPMKAEGSAAAADGLGRQRERSNRWRLRVMRWIAVAAGRRATRLLLHPIACLLLPRAAGRAATRPLSRARARPAGDLARRLPPLSTPSRATVLDRVYLLQERFDEFRFEASGIEAILEPSGRGEGVLAFGAHLGSFEALRMIGHDKGLRVAMIMYEDNARLINETLRGARAEEPSCTRSRSAGSTPCWRCAAGSTTAASPACSPTAPCPATTRSARRRWSCPSSARRRCFPDGPFRLAAHAAPQGRLHGRPLPRRQATTTCASVELADFPSAAARRRRRARRGDPGRRSQRYVATLEALCREAPYNWFNFYDFWADADRRPARSRDA